MKIDLANQLKTLREAKGVTQEKVSEYLGVSYQAISKWENGITSPDITLLPDIARYFDITVDQLLQVEQIDTDEYFDNCCKEAEQWDRDGKREENIQLWCDAYQKLPNDNGYTCFRDNTLAQVDLDCNKNLNFGAAVLSPRLFLVL